MSKDLKRSIVLFVISLIMVVVMMVFNIDNKLMWLLAYAIGAYEKAMEGIRLTLRDKSLNVEFLMILAAIGAAWIGYYSEGVILILIFSFSGILEEYSMNKAQTTLTSLLTLAPETAILLNGNQQKVVDAKSLKVGDLIRVPVGQQVAADGMVVFGSTHINQATITGEFEPVFKKVGDEIFAGTMNVEGVIHVEVKKDSQDFLVSKMISFVEEAKNNKTLRQSAIEKFEAYYVYVVLVIAAMIMIFLSVYRGIVFLVVASPCALVASIAPGMLSAMSWGGQHGVLIKGSKALELVAKSEVMVFDKTGTITKGMPVVHHFVMSEAIDQQQLINRVYAMESQSTHPLAEVIVEYLKPRVSDFIEVEISEIAGKGVTYEDWKIGNFAFDKALVKIEENKGSSMVKVIYQNELLAYFYLQDTIREDASSTLRKLKDMNIRTILLTGDHAQSVQSLSTELSFDEVYTDLLPQDKAAIIEKLKKEYRCVTMIGDGINDAPSLASADVGIAMGQASDIALETSDIVFMNNKLSNAVSLLQVARQAQNIIKQNIIFSMSVLFILVVFNFAQSITLPLGVVFHEGSTILVILNGLRLLWFRDKA